MNQLFFYKRTYRAITLSIILCGLLMSFSLQGATIPIAKIDGTPLVIPSYSAGEILEITGDSLEAGDWNILNSLTTDYHLIMQTSNKQVADHAFEFCTSLLSVSFPEVLSIGKNAFLFCSNLTAVSFPKAISIEEYAFYESGLITASFPKVKSIGATYAFGYCYDLTSASFPEADFIGGGAFYSCDALASVYFPVATFLGDGCFGGCEALTSVSFPEAITILGGAFGHCSGLTFVSIPKAVSTGYAAFSNCTGLTFIAFPEMTLVGNNAFENCTRLASVSIPKVTSIGNNAFLNCTRLTGIALGTAPPSLGIMNPFNGVSALLLVVPDSTIYTSTVLAGYPAGTEAFNKNVAMKSETLVSGVESILTPDRMPTLSGGYYRWERDGLSVTGAATASYQTASGGIYTLHYVRDELSVMLLSVHLAAIPYDLYGTYNRYQECENMLRLSFIPSASGRTVEVWSEGTGSAYVFDMENSKHFNDTLLFDLPARDSTLTIPYGIDKDVEDASRVTFFYRVSGGVTEQTDTFTLYARPEIKVVKYYAPTVLFEGLLTLSVTNGSLYIQRSLDDGLSWQFARDTITGEALPFSHRQLAEFEPGDSILFRQPGGCVDEVLVVGEAEEEFPGILRSVTIPAIDEAICSVSEGKHYLWSREQFSFTIRPTGSNAGKKLHVSTSRVLVPDSEGVLITDNQDGSFTVTILYIQEEVTVAIDFATGIESIDGNDVWSYGNCLYIRSDEAGEASVCTIAGSLVEKIRIRGSETIAVTLPDGLYIVLLHSKAYKVIVR